MVSNPCKDPSEINDVRLNLGTPFHDVSYSTVLVLLPSKDIHQRPPDEASRLEWADSRRPFFFEAPTGLNSGKGAANLQDSGARCALTVLFGFQVLTTSKSKRCNLQAPLNNPFGPLRSLA